jgi:DNA polymerase-3 subunit epsilon
MQMKVPNFTAIDFETGSGYRNSVCQVGLVRVERGIIIETYSSLIRPPDNFIRPDWTESIHGISPEDTTHAPPFAESYPRWRHFVEGQTLVAHSAKFDMGCLAACLEEFCGIAADFDAYCTCDTWRGTFDSASLDACCAALGVTLTNHHNALADAEACARLFLLAQEQGRELKRYFWKGGDV